MTLKIFTVGGTIDKIYFDQKSTYQVGEPAIVEILREANVTIPFECQTIMQKDSLELTTADRQLIFDTIQADSHRHVVITHGTDTMIETAKFLQPLTDRRTIVLTGSMMPARFKNSDAVFNIGCAVTAAQTLPPGVYIAMNGQIFNPHKAWKNVPENRFEQTEG